jgi:hypothetical protein
MEGIDVVVDISGAFSVAVLVALLRELEVVKSADVVLSNTVLVATD